MKKNFTLLFSIIAVFFLLTACKGNNIENETCSHSYGSWETVIEPTCLNIGKQERYCIYCNNREEENLSITTHIWSTPICNQKQTCIYCNIQSTEKILHTTDRGTCERCGEYYISKENQIIDENVRHEKTLNDLYTDYSSQFDYLEGRANYYYNRIDYQKSYVNSQCSYYSSQVSNLKTKLAIAKLDTSAAGKAKVREIESQLSEAESEYNYFIAQQFSWEQYDSYCNQLESLNAQYQSNKNKENKLYLDNLEKINKLEE